MEDTEIAVCRSARNVSKPIERLAEHIIRALEMVKEPAATRAKAAEKLSVPS